MILDFKLILIQGSIIKNKNNYFLEFDMKIIRNGMSWLCKKILDKNRNI